jgi:hypothetical protein
MLYIILVLGDIAELRDIGFIGVDFIYAQISLKTRFFSIIEWG